MYPCAAGKYHVGDCRGERQRQVDDPATGQRAGSARFRHCADTGRELDYGHLPRIRRTMGYSVQGAGLFPHLTVRDNVTLVARLEGWPAARIRDRYDGLLALFGLDDELSGRFPFSLSGGQAQRVGLCRAMMLDPPLLLLDEPFSGLDPITRASIYREMLQLEDTGDRSILLVTHDMDEAARLAGHLVILKQGRVVQQGSPRQVKASPADDYVRDYSWMETGMKINLRHILALLVLCPLAAPGLCADGRQGTDSSPSRGGPRPARTGSPARITVGSKNFNESYLLAEIISQALELEASALIESLASAGHWSVMKPW